MTAKKPRKKADRHVITLRVTPALHKKLRMAAASGDTTIQALVLQGAAYVLGDGRNCQ